MTAAIMQDFAGEVPKIRSVFRYDRPFFEPGNSEDVRVWCSPKVRTLGDRDNVVASLLELRCDRWTPHFIQ